jgi:hypothetical protein
MTQWRNPYRGQDDITEEFITAGEFVDNGEWVDLVLEPVGGDQERLPRVRASDVMGVRSVTDPHASAIGQSQDTAGRHGDPR